LDFGKLSKVVCGLAITSLCLFSTNFASPVLADENNSSWVDLDNDGLVDKDLMSKEERQKYDKRVKEIESYFDKIGRTKAKLNALKRQLKANGKDLTISNEIITIQQELDDLENNIEKNIGLKKISKQDSITTLATAPSDIDMDGTIYLDVFNPSRYVARGDWDWITSNWQYDRSGTGDVGKLDAFGLILDEEIDIYSHSIRTYWSYDGRESTPGAIYDDKAESDNGWGWKWQDKISYQTTSLGATVKTYNSGSGIATLYFKFENPSTGSGDTVEISTEYAHTWNTTNVDNISFSLTDISFSYSSSSSRWSDEENWPIQL
jgi:hypothetical protein